MTLRFLSIVVLATCLTAFARQPQVAGDPKIDPLALAVLRKTTDTIRDAKNYSFTARVARERLGTNGQIITRFATHKVTVSRPDKVRIETHTGQNQDVQVLFNGGRTFLFSPGPNLYAATTAPATIDAALAGLEQKGIIMPVRNLLESDPYKSLEADVKSAYVIGRTDAFGKTLHQLAFTEPGAEWQLWVEGGDRPVPVRIEIIDKSMPEHPRVTVDLSDWNFNPDVSQAVFSFTPPQGARQIEFPRAMKALKKGRKS
ncbi:MAG: DUF2092 domain-containing protein [Bryobacteraceae bacterium]